MATTVTHGHLKSFTRLRVLGAEILLRFITKLFVVEHLGIRIVFNVGRTTVLDENVLIEYRETARLGTGPSVDEGQQQPRNDRKTGRPSDEIVFEQFG